jgi:hypothetical protein
LREEGQLIIPNTTAKTKPEDLLAYFAGGLILFIPFLPIPKLHLTFALATLFFYLAVFALLGSLDFYNKFAKSWIQSFSLWFSLSLASFRQRFLIIFGVASSLFPQKAK